jgi:IS30 family transposase
MMSYTHFTLNERKYLQELLSKGYSFRKIADFLGRNVSSVSREVNRNKSKYPPKKKSNNKFRYHAWRAQTLSVIRRRENQKYCLAQGSDEWEYIVEKLSLYWSPEEISARWKLEHPDSKGFSTSTIYRYIKKKRFEGISRKTHLRRRGKLILPRSSCYNSIQPERIIPEWPEEIKRRSRIGDWEGDTVYGGVGKGLLVTQVDRKSRFLCAALLPKREAKLTKDVIVNMFQGLPVKSISLDNGSEFAEFRSLEKELHTLVYFAEPHKPWQRGTNENTNDILRFFFPKGFDFRSITQDDVDFVVNLLNNRPRKCLGWKTPAEIFFDKSVALA